MVDRNGVEPLARGEDEMVGIVGCGEWGRPAAAAVETRLVQSQTPKRRHFLLYHCEEEVRKRCCSDRMECSEKKVWELAGLMRRKSDGRGGWRIIHEVVGLARQGS